MGNIGGKLSAVLLRLYLFGIVDGKQKYTDNLVFFHDLVDAQFVISAVLFVFQLLLLAGQGFLDGAADFGRAVYGKKILADAVFFRFKNLPGGGIQTDYHTVFVQDD